MPKIIIDNNANQEDSILVEYNETRKGEDFSFLFFQMKESRIWRSIR